MMTRFGIFWTAAFLALTGAAQADEVVVVELFTSQGCSSCPPADRILGELAEEDNVIALALHVDYWDYLGWKDEFASAAHTERQRAYARAKGERTIYTPQMVIGGVDHIVGSRGMRVAKTVQKHADQKKPITVQLQRNGGTVSVRATASGNVPNVIVQLATFSPKEVVNVRRGENAGRKLTYHNVVRKMATIGTWDGQGTYSASANVSGGAPVAVIIQAGKGGPILGAAQLR
ncbi:MAG: DUF1223 domain-containing protein [Paracoccaceae bacterium]